MYSAISKELTADTGNETCSATTSYAVHSVISLDVSVHAQMHRRTSRMLATADFVNAYVKPRAADKLSASNQSMPLLQHTKETNRPTSTSKDTHSAPVMPTKSAYDLIPSKTTHLSSAFCTELTSNPTPALWTVARAATAREP